MAIHRRGSVPLKAVLAVALCAIGGVGLVWSGSRLAGGNDRFSRDALLKARSDLEARAQNGPSGPEGGPGPGERNQDPAPPPRTYPTIADEQQARAQVAPVRSAVAAAAGKPGAIGEMGGQAADELARVASAYLEPFLVGSQAEFRSTVERLGGVNPAPSSDLPPGAIPGFGPLAGLLERAAIDPTGVEVVPVNLDPNARREREDGFRAVMQSAPSGLFPEAEKFREAGARAAEVRMPTRLTLPGGKTADATVVMTMAWNGARAKWQPAGWQIEMHDRESLSAVNEHMRALRDASQTTPAGGNGGGR